VSDGRAHDTTAGAVKVMSLTTKSPVSASVTAQTRQPFKSSYRQMGSSDGRLGTGMSCRPIAAKGRFMRSVGPA